MRNLPQKICFFICLVGFMPLTTFAVDQQVPAQDQSSTVRQPEKEKSTEMEKMEVKEEDDGWSILKELMQETLDFFYSTESETDTTQQRKQKQ
ncbi:MAG: hypothetical protein AAFR61_05675 [Bacteroidota bacterium]